MENHIEKLVNATEKISVSYHLAFTTGGKPDIGVRKSEGSAVIIDNVTWLISGDIYNANTDKRISDIKEMYWQHKLYVNLHAQAIIYGKIVTVDLGNRHVLSKYNFGTEGGELVLA